MTSERYRVGEFTFEPASGELTGSDGIVHPLQPQPATLLAVLVEQAGRVVPREVLYEALWPNTKVEFDLGLNAAVRTLRAALGDDAQAPRYLETLRKRGYRLIADVEPLPVRAGTEGGTEASATALDGSAALKGAPLSGEQGGASVQPAVHDGEGARKGVPATRWARTAAVAVMVLGGVAWWASLGEASGAKGVQVPELTEARFLVSEGDSAARSRGLALLASLPPDLRTSADGLQIEALAAYRSGDLDVAGALARRALAEDPDHAPALEVLGQVALYRDYDAELAERLLGRAAEVDGSARSLQTHALALASLGDFRAAMRQIRRAVELDPVTVNITFDGWFIAYLSRDYATSQEWCDSFSRLAGVPRWRCQIYSALAMDQDEEAVELARQLIEANLPEPEWPRADATGEETLRTFWEWELQRPRPRASPGSIAFSEARALVLLDRYDEAIQRLERARGLGAVELAFARHLPYFDALRGRPGFEEVVEPRGGEAMTARR